MKIVEKKIKSTFEAVHDFVLEAADLIKNIDDLEVDDLLFKINIMLREVLNNAVEHGNNFDDSKFIYCKIFCKNETFIFEIEDEGEGFVANDFYMMDEGFTMKNRSRGLELIEKYGFKYRFKKNKVIVEYDLNKERLS